MPLLQGYLRHAPAHQMFMFPFTRFYQSNLELEGRVQSLEKLFVVLAETIPHRAAAALPISGVNIIGVNTHSWTEPLKVETRDPFA